MVVIALLCVSRLVLVLRQYGLLAGMASIQSTVRAERRGRLVFWVPGRGRRARRQPRPWRQSPWRRRTSNRELLNTTAVSRAAQVTYSRFSAEIAGQGRRWKFL